MKSIINILLALTFWSSIQAQTISIIGTATQHNDWSMNVNLTNIATTTVWIGTLPLYAGTTFGSPNAVKFKHTDNWGTNWGSNTFPTGIGTQDGDNIPIPVTGYYDVSINTATGAYSFTPHNTIIYVNDDANDALGYRHGQDWAHAYTSLQDALALAHWFTSVGEVWVAAGTYKPSAYPHGCSGCATARDYTFHLRDGLKIYGGFATETSIGARNIAANPTILSGDFYGNDMVTGSGATLTIAGNGENAHHVVLAVAPSSGGIGVTVDGFNITGGNSNDSPSITINSSSINSYTAGGISTEKGTNNIVNNLIYENSAFYLGGAAALGGKNGNNNIINNIVSDNNGRAIELSYSGNPNINNYIINNIIRDNNGSGVVISDDISENSRTLIKENLISNNGRGGVAVLACNCTIDKNIIIGNNSSGVGGGIYAWYGRDTIINNKILNNNAIEGGGLYLTQLNYLANNSIYGNNATLKGGGIFAYNTSYNSNTYRNNIFSNNTISGDPLLPGADYNHAAGGYGQKSIFYSNIMQLESSQYNAANLNSLGVESSGNLFQIDPLFVNPFDFDGMDNIYRTSDDGLSITSGSPAINAGILSGAPTDDITGYTRIGNPDIGAYEHNPCAGTILLVNAAATGSNNGLSWANAFTSLQSALQKAHDCPTIQEVWVAAGTYKPSAYPHGCIGCATDRDYTFHLRDGLKIYGGFAGTETNIEDRDIAANPTILSGDFGDIDMVTGSGATLSISGNDGNAYHVVLAVAPETGGIGVTVDGFRVTGGNADGAATITVNSQNVNGQFGGGIFTYFGTNTLTNNTIYGNNGDNYGGGITLLNGTNTLTNNTIYGNNANYNGGGIYLLNGTNTITNNTIYGNNAGLGGGIRTNNGTNTITNNTIYGNNAGNGGGIRTNNGTNTLTNNTIYENSAGNGGGIKTEYGNNTMTNNTIYGNQAGNNGGGIQTLNGTNILTNNTIYGNQATDLGGGFYAWLGSNTIANNIFWANQKSGSTTVAGADFIISSYPGATFFANFTNNMLQLANNPTNYPGGTTYSNNIYAQDPLFVNPSDPDGIDNIHRTADDGLFIQPCSPAINAGTPTGAPAQDITGYTRTGNPDIGAYENNPTVVSRIFVKANATGLNNGTSWANAFTSLQSALQKAHLCADIDEVWVAAGTYKPSAYPQGCSGCATSRDYTFHLRDGLKIYGGFAGTETSIGARNIAANPTILSGDFNGNDMVTGSGATLSITGNGENAHHVVLAVAPSTSGIGVTVDGFRITGGNADGLIYLFVNSIIIHRTQGGGIYIVSGNNIVRNNVIFGNYASFGAGCFLTDGTNTFNNNISYNNYSSQNGGGIQASGNSINSLYNNNSNYSAIISTTY